MNYEEYKEKIGHVDSEISELYEKKHQLKERYIEDNANIPFVKRQIVNLTLDKTKFRRKTQKYEKTGERYMISGMLIGYCIADDGELRPDFFGGVEYPLEDEIVSIHIGEQRKERCRDCSFRYFYGCFDVDHHDDDYVCGWFKKDKGVTK